jgi:hypothetical protein
MSRRSHDLDGDGAHAAEPRHALGVIDDDKPVSHALDHLLLQHSEPPQPLTRLRSGSTPASAPARMRSPRQSSACTTVEPVPRPGQRGTNDVGDGNSTEGNMSGWVRPKN